MQNAEKPEDTRPRYCPRCGEEIDEDDTNHTGREPGVVDIWELECSEHGPMAVNIPLDDVEKAAEKLEGRQQGGPRSRRGRRGGRR